MRFIGQLPDEQGATTFSDVLLAMGIEHQIEPELESEAGAWALWVHSEDDVAGATEQLKQYLRDPSGFTARARAGSVKRRLAEEESAPEAASSGETLRRVFPHGVGSLTLVLAVSCLAISGAVWAGYGPSVFDQLLITHITPEGRNIQWDATLPEIFRQGEFWRLITPAMVHFSVVHLLLNLLWLIDLGSAIEGRQGTGRLAILFVSIAIGSNLAQTWLAGPAFCGVSGVLFGFLGYMWMKGKLDPEAGLALHPYTVVLMLVYFSLGLGGVFNLLFGISMANGAHASGLVLGMIWGIVTSLRRILGR